VHRHQPRSLQRLQVFRHLGLAQLERERDLADGPRGGAEQADDPQPIRFGQGGEQRGIHTGGVRHSCIFSLENTLTKGAAVPEEHRIERTYPTSSEDVWQLWTTSEGIESWWAPDGFTVEVEKLDLVPGGELVYTMTATAPEQIEFMRTAGLPLTTRSRKRFTEVAAPKRLAYTSLVDFVPDVPPYEFQTDVDLEPSENGVTVTMMVEEMHDQVWTERLLTGRANELDNLARVIEHRRGA
jgi:uncharacterized protein YndB with AHSA1/START domain